MNMFKPTSAKTPEEYISMVDEPRRSEIQKLHNLIRETVPDLKPFIISGMIGYGLYHYKSASGREGDWAIVGLASQKNYISVYVCATDGKQYVAEKYKKALPKASIGKSCIRFKKTDNIDLDVLKKILREGEATMKG
jgi:uncharacterized protein YdhG (YjbR/CyaY superfamily)